MQYHHLHTNLHLHPYQGNSIGYIGLNKRLIPCRSQYLFLKTYTHPQQATEIRFNMNDTSKLNHIKEYVSSRYVKK